MAASLSRGILTANIYFQDSFMYFFKR
jgi:hypothetical protein